MHAAPRRQLPPLARDPLLSVVVPAWNEAAFIGDCLTELQRALGHLHPEVIVVDDGSRDDTAGVCAAWAQEHSELRVVLIAAPHRGKGAAVYTGVQASHGAWVAYIDADLDVPAAEILRLMAVRERQGLDVVVGSKRRLDWCAAPRPLHRRLLSLAFSWLVRVLFRLPVRDTQTGIKLFPGPWIRSIVAHATVHGFLFDVELLGAAAAAGLRVGEVRVAVAMRRPVSRLGAADVLRSAVELVAVVRSVHRLRRWLQTAGLVAERVWGAGAAASQVGVGAAGSAGTAASGAAWRGRL